MQNSFVIPQHAEILGGKGGLWQLDDYRFDYPL